MSPRWGMFAVCLLAILVGMTVTVLAAYLRSAEMVNEADGRVLLNLGLLIMFAGFSGADVRGDD